MQGGKFLLPYKSMKRHKDVRKKIAYDYIPIYSAIAVKIEHTDFAASRQGGPRLAVSFSTRDRIRLCLATAPEKTSAASRRASGLESDEPSATEHHASHMLRYTLDKGSVQSWRYIDLSQSKEE